MLAKRLLSSVAMPVANGPFEPFPSAIYARRQATRGSLVTLFRVTWDPGSATLTYGSAITRTGMTRVLYGLPARSSLNKVPLFGRDYIAAPVAATANPSSDYALADGPELPYALAQLSSNITTVAGSLTVTASNSAYANASAITIRAAADTMRFNASASDVSQINNILQYPIQPHTVTYTDGDSNKTAPPAGKYTAIIAANAYTKVSASNGDVVTSLIVDGTDVTKSGYTLANYPATNWSSTFSGSETFSGSSTNGANSMQWTYTTQWTGVNILQYDPTHHELYFWNSDPTRGASTAGSWNLVGGQTTETATYSLALPVAPTAVNDDAVTLGLYDVSTIVSASPSTTVDATAYYAETYDSYGGYTAIVPYNAAGGVQPSVPAPANAPYYREDGTNEGASDAFTLPTGAMVKAATLVARTFTTPSAFRAFAQTNTAAASATTANVVPAVTDTCGSRLVTATYASGPQTYSFAIEDLGATATYSLAVAATAYVNTGDAVLWYTTDATQGVTYPTVFSKNQPTDAFAQQGTTAGSITYQINPTLLYTPTSVPFMMTIDPTPQPVGLSGLPGNGLDPLYDAPEDALNVGRSVSMTAGSPFYLGTRAGVSYFAVSGTSTWCELVPISSVGSLQEASQTWQGQTVKRVGIKHTSRSFAGVVGVQGDVATVYPVSGTTGVSWYDVGQIVDGSGAATGTYVSWSSPGQTWSRAKVALGGSTTFGTAITPTCLYSAAEKDWILGSASSGTAQVDLSATMQTPGPAANVHTVTAPSGAPYLVAVLPHVGGLLYSNLASSPTYMLSLDAGATWQQITVSGTPVTGGNGAPSLWPGQPLWAY